MFILALNLLWSLPLALYFWARRESPQKVWQYTGAGFGFIVAPASMGLYGFFFLSPFTAPLGILGLLLVLTHGEPGYKLAIALNLVEPATVVRGVQHVYTEALAGLVWAPVYGVIGFSLDWLIARKHRQA